MRKILLLMLLGLFVACQQEQKQEVVNASIEKAQAMQAEALGLTIDEFKEMPDAVKAKRKMGLLLLPYLQLDSVNNIYILNISKEEALKLGVTEKEYEERMKEVAATNETIRSLMLKGDTVRLINPEKVLQEQNKVVDKREGKLYEVG